MNKSLDEGLALASEVVNMEKWKVLYCLTLYNETFDQILQSLAGWVRSIIELERKNEQKYDHAKFGIILVLDGFDKIDPDVLEKLIEYKIVDPAACWDTLLRTDPESKEYIKRSYIKKETKIAPFTYQKVEGQNVESSKYLYATNNVAHIFSK